MKDIKDLEMPSKAGVEAPEEEFDFGFGEEGAEEEAAAPLEAVSDEDLIAEMQKRGFEVEDVAEEAEDMPEAPAEMPEEEMEV
jgi:hypothetical protein